jgi:hypothetical protein
VAEPPKTCEVLSSNPSYHNKKSKIRAIKNSKGTKWTGGVAQVVEHRRNRNHANTLSYYNGISLRNQ